MPDARMPDGQERGQHAIGPQHRDTAGKDDERRRREQEGWRAVDLPACDHRPDNTHHHDRQQTEEAVDSDRSDRFAAARRPLRERVRARSVGADASRKKPANKGTDQVDPRRRLRRHGRAAGAQQDDPAPDHDAAVEREQRQHRDRCRRRQAEQRLTGGARGRS